MSSRSRAALAFLMVALPACSAEKRPDVATGSNPVAQPTQTADSLSTAAATTGTPPSVVGGACEYTKFPGTCTVTATGQSPAFRFEGSVAGKDVKLEGNEAAPGSRESFAKVEVGASQPCTLEFITKGTCTPCMLSVGSCGQAAWELFRAQPR